MGSLLVGSVGRSPWPGSVDLESSVDPSKQTSKTGYPAVHPGPRVRVRVRAHNHNHNHCDHRALVAIN